MHISNDVLSLYLITDRSYHPKKELTIQIEDAIAGGVTCIQLREKHLGFNETVALGHSIRKLTTAYKIPLIVNDSPVIAKTIKADGVHIGQSDGEIKAARAILGSDAIIGVTAKTVEQAIAAETSGADYLGVGAIYPSKSKIGAQGITMATLKAIVASVNIPVVAIGGLTNDNIDILKKSGIQGIAVISAILDHKDIKSAAFTLKSHLKEVLS